MMKPIISSNCKWPKECKLATAYVPYQDGVELYTPEQALKCGTLFPCLNGAGYSQLGGRS